MFFLATTDNFAVKVEVDGAVSYLDFGLAKIYRNLAPNIVEKNFETQLFLQGPMF
jgi:hypothetical protein